MTNANPASATPSRDLVIPSSMPNTTRGRKAAMIAKNIATETNEDIEIEKFPPVSRTSASKGKAISRKKAFSRL